jgi:hypothetical protein
MTDLVVLRDAETKEPILREWFPIGVHVGKHFLGVSVLSPSQGKVVPLTLHIERSILICDPSRTHIGSPLKACRICLDDVRLPHSDWLDIPQTQVRGDHEPFRSHSGRPPERLIDQARDDSPVEDSGKPAEFFPWDKSGLDMAVLKIEGKLEPYWVVLPTGETAIVRGKKEFHNDLLLTLFFQPFL